MNRIQFPIKLLFLLLVLTCCEQKSKHWLYFDSKLKIHQDVDLISGELDQLDLSLEYYSEWLHAGTVLLSSEDKEALQKLKFITSIEPSQNIDFKPMSLGKEESMSFALEQIGAESFVSAGLDGKGVKIGIIDGGFLDANIKGQLSHVFKHEKVKAYKDFITPDLRQYGGSKYADDQHGTDVWTQVAGINEERKVRFGLAPNAEYYLARTDDGRKEYRKEEEYLIEALEWMHKHGVKLVNISLGYSIGFDNPSENYLPKHINGSYTAVTRAAAIATDEKGMLLVVSAGNDGDNPFKVLSAPADAKGVITVGATNFKTWEKASYSSQGPEQLDYIKPNVSCFASSGTSFSAPVITGLAACIMQQDKSLTNLDIKSLIEQSSHLYPFGNNYVGYGVPNCKRLLKLTNNLSTLRPTFIKSIKRKLKMQLPDDEGFVVLFHKKDSVNVILQRRLPFEEGEVIISHPKEAKFTTLSFKDFVQEIAWE
ncbi:MAG: S8 family serine peptidase [Cyclobacteriaceae bacterium]